MGSGYENPGNENIRIVANLLFLAVLAALFVVRYVVLEPLLKVLKATLQNYGRLYILDVRAITWGTRCFPDYSLYIVFFIFS